VRIQNSKTIFYGHRRNKNLRDILVKAKLEPVNEQKIPQKEKLMFNSTLQILPSSKPKRVYHQRHNRPNIFHVEKCFMKISQPLLLHHIIKMQPTICRTNKTPANGEFSEPPKQNQMGH